MADIAQSSRDWLSKPRTNAIAWWLPKAAIIAGLFFPVPARAGTWIIALLWMGTACILNSRRCGRTHCRYTGPYYLVMIVPVLVLASGVVSAGFYAWLSLAIVILGGSMFIWWVTERAWGKFSRLDDSF
jgi:asparagine N-glycosylation enzyme membrane subunit Stt3